MTPKPYKATSLKSAERQVRSATRYVVQREDTGYFYASHLSPLSIRLPEFTDDLRLAYNSFGHDLAEDAHSIRREALAVGIPCCVRSVTLVLGEKV